MDADEICDEIIRRIRSNEPFVTSGSVRSRAKMGARNAELSDLLGWIRKNSR